MLEGGKDPETAMKKITMKPVPPKPKAKYNLSLTIEAPWDADDRSQETEVTAQQVVDAVRHHLRKAGVSVISIGLASAARKKIVQVLRGDSLPPVTREAIDNTRNPFEIEVHRDIGLIQLFAEQSGQWVETAYLILPEEPKQ